MATLEDIGNLYEMESDTLASFISVRFNCYGTLLEDLMQETFLRAAENVGTFEERNGATVRTWVYKIAINLARDHIREKRRYMEVQEVDVGAGDTASLFEEGSWELWREELCSLLSNPLYGLRELERDAILGYYDGISDVAIARRNKIPFNHVRKHRFNARGKLLRLRESF